MEVKCKTQDYLDLHELTEFQGGLKERDDKDYAKIQKSIEKYGFAFPFFVWKHDGINHVLDGHGRFGALNRMVAKGEQLPKLPVVYVDCADEEAAKNLLLRLNSQYGRMTAETIIEFMDGFQLDIDDLALPSGTIDLHIEPETEETTGDDDAPEVNEDEEPNSVLGEMYALGDHILMCGDSTNSEGCITFRFRKVFVVGGPNSGEVWHLITGDELTDKEQIAEGHGIHHIEAVKAKAARLFGIKGTNTTDWKKNKGIAKVTNDDKTFTLEIHWYEIKGHGKIFFKEKFED